MNHTELNSDDMRLVKALCSWLDNIVESGEIEEIKEKIEEFRRDYERNKYEDL